MIEVYSHDKHLPILGRWLSNWGITPPPRALFSDIGFVANGIAMGFLFTTNSATAYIDHMAADPNSSAEARDIAITDLFNHLEVVADSSGHKFLTVMSRIPAMRDRVTSLGFTQDKEYMLYYKILGGEKCLG